MTTKLKELYKNVVRHIVYKPDIELEHVYKPYKFDYMRWLVSQAGYAWMGGHFAPDPSTYTNYANDPEKPQWLYCILTQHAFAGTVDRLFVYDPRLRYIMMDELGRARRGYGVVQAICFKRVSNHPRNMVALWHYRSKLAIASEAQA